MAAACKVRGWTTTGFWRKADFKQKQALALTEQALAAIKTVVLTPRMPPKLRAAHPPYQQAPATANKPENYQNNSYKRFPDKRYRPIWHDELHASDLPLSVRAEPVEARALFANSPSAASGRTVSLRQVPHQAVRIKIFDTTTATRLCSRPRAYAGQSAQHHQDWGTSRRGGCAQSTTVNLATLNASHFVPWRGKFTCARASSPAPSMASTLPSPNLV